MLTDARGHLAIDGQVAVVAAERPTTTAEPLTCGEVQSQVATGTAQAKIKIKI